MTSDESPTFIFHIGLERTGSTSFQRFCTVNAEHLSRSGILYPTKALAFRGDNHGPLVASYLEARCGSPDFAIHARRAKKPALLQSLFKAAAKQVPAVVLLSSEHFSSRFEAAEIDALARDFAGRPCKILVVVRDHQQRFFSAYATSILSGRHLTIEAYADEVLAPDNRYFRYQTIIESWERAFGRAAMVVVPHRSDGCLIQTLLERIAPRALAIPVAEGYVDNRALGPGCTEALRLVNSALAGRFAGMAPRSYWAWLQKRYCEVRLRRWLVAAAGTQHREPWHLGASHLAQLEVLAAADRAWLARAYGIEMAAPGADGGQAAFKTRRNRLDATQILARALQDRILGQWNLVDAAIPDLIHVARLWHRWRMKGL